MYVKAITKECAIEKLCAITMIVATLDKVRHFNLALYQTKRRFKSNNIVQLQEQLPQYIIVGDNLN